MTTSGQMAGAGAGRLTGSGGHDRISAPSRSHPGTSHLAQVRRELLTVRPHATAHWGALRAAFGIALPVGLLLACGRPEWIGYACFGCFVAVYGRHATWRARLETQLGVGLVLTVTAVLGTAVGVTRPDGPVTAALLLCVSGLGLLLAKRHGWAPAPSVFLVFAAGATSSMPVTAADLLPALCVTAGSAALGVAVGQLGRLLPADPRERGGRTPTTYRSLLRGPGAFRELAGYTAGPFLATLLASWAGFGHPSWAGVAATIPLAGASAAARTARGALRFTGTLAGIVVTYLVLDGNPSAWVLWAVSVAAMLLAELFIARHYGIAVIGITPTALLTSYLAAPQPLRPMLTDRVVETAVGVLVSLFVLGVAARVGRREGAVAGPGSGSEPTAPGVRGRVLGPGGIPVPGAVVTLLAPSGAQLGRTDVRDDGSYVLEASAGGDHVLVASACGHEPRVASVQVPAAGEPLTFALVLTSTSTSTTTGGLFGTVRADGLPRPGALVVATDERGKVVGSARSAECGGYRIASLPPGTCTVATSADGCRPAAVRATVTGGAPTRQDTELRPAATVRGTVQAGGGVPLADARVSLLDGSGNVVAAHTTGGDGAYAFTGLEAAGYTLVAAGYPPATAGFRTGGTGSATVDLVLQHAD
ncbi:carboxypeptidase regulatory-like domain-containing protein [Streptomyces sp. NPDC051684]|uniref:carboxypeptidase regulatory-like domain-containing protein n=1 Tax=Streptomyces sp. NPDC051684 TaxID=3365670 RepID=UPI0037B0D23E